ncbi:HNH endonuclease [Photobacterium phosphoreum]|uniref:HNH endonuclease n=1 Tax=Photobacterium phosphoreum TaxID=659 RepID=A0A2T3JL18_PHOPO|nr:HNH endonuclease [Photobacterium phosphoreum]PSU24470.1 HNH endonuclease [Photobacterium phosphoreum]PSU44390.1 HNH endonuclease [Photobacterium phosphoreum]PSU49658.1 HNH endonuclease [Photobacterium phosphoreum]
MKLTVDFSALYKAIAPLGGIVTSFTITKRSDSIQSVAKDLVNGKILGEDIQLDEIDGSNGVLIYEGLQVMLYIPDQGNAIESAIVNGKGNGVKRVHIAECRTIIDMRNKGRFHNRYVVTSRIDGKFNVFGQSNVSFNTLEGESDLSPCINCMKELNVEGYLEKTYQNQKDFIVSFSYGRLFESYSSYFKTMPIASADYYSGDYTSNWASISSDLRNELDYICEHCSVSLKDHKKLLHSHHINGNKSDNKRENLRALCADCHKKQPHHGHLYVSNEDTLIINRLRREQGKIDPFNYDDLIRYADSALSGLLSKCKANRIPCGELGSIENISGKLVPLDLCWKSKKVAVIVNKEHKILLKNKGWIVFSVYDAINSFPDFQNLVR